MERRKDYGTLAVLRRFARRRWRSPAKIAGVWATVLLLSGVTYLIPRPRKTAPAVDRPGQVAPGVVESLRQKGVGSEFQGSLLEVAVKPGSPVKKGDLLFRLDTSSFSNDLSASRAQAAAARRGLKETYAQRAADLREYESSIAAIRKQIREARKASQITLVNTGADQYVTTVPAASLDTTLLEGSLRDAQAQLEMRRQSWEPALQGGRESIAAAERDMKRLKGLIAAGTRRSPLTGVVTAIYAHAGDYVAAHRPIVRVDDPSGYRVVTKVGEKAKQALQPGAKIQLSTDEGAATGRLVKIESGWDRDLFRYYLWVKPAASKGLQPGEPVSIKLPSGEMAAN